MKKSSVLLEILRRHFKRPVAFALALFFPLWTMQVRGATLFYQGFDGPWDATTQQWSTDSSLLDQVTWADGSIAAFFADPGTITLGGPITAGGLIFGSDGNLVTDGTLTLAAIAGVSSPLINVASLKRATIDSVIAGTSGLTKTGNGTLVLGSAANTFSGDVVINGGNVVITDEKQLGTGTTTISVNGLANTGNPGYSGGSLILQGGLEGMTLSRNISISGRGPGATNNSGALISVGNNTIAGNIVIGGTASQGNIVSAYGITTITGDVQLGNGSTQTLFGNGNYIISGQVTGFEVANDRFAKSGNAYPTTLWLQNPNNNFAESVRIDSGTVRVSTNSALGYNISTQSVDLNNGILEVRTDTPGVGNADFSARKVFNRDSTNTGIFVSRDINGSAINQTVVFGETRATGGNTNFRITGRDGFNVTLQGLNNSPTGVMGQGGGNNALIENNSNGLLTLATSSLWNQGDATARTLTIQGNGDTLLTGSITRTGGGAHAATKSGNGTLTIQGTNSTFIGSFNINAGTVVINSFGAINNGPSGALQLNAGALSYVGAAGTGVGEITSKSVNLTGTTGSGILLANQAGTSPSALIISNGVAATGAGIKSLYLGGTSTLQNTIGGVIQNNSGTNTTSLVKIGSGTWLYAPSSSSYVTTAATGVTTTGGGAVQSNSFTVSNAAGLVVGQTVTGTNVPAGSIITAINGSTITISNPIGTTAVASGTALTFGTTSNFTGSVTVAGGTLQIMATAGTGSGSDVINDTSALIFNVDPLNTNQVAGGTFEYLGYSGGAITESLGALTMTAGAATLKITAGGGATGLIFSSLSTPAIGTGLNVIGDGTVTLTGVATSTATTLPGNGHIYFNGADFARSESGTLVAPVYDTDAGFVTAGAALTAGNHNLVTADTSSGALTISSLKIAGDQIVAQTGLLTINLGANTSGGILMTGGSGTISGTGVTTAGNQDLVVRVDGMDDTLLISAPITSTTTGGLTKNGLGTLVLSGANAEGGTVTVNEGTLQLSGAGLIGATNVNLTIRQGATLDLNGVNIGTLASANNSVNALNGSGLITNSAASGTATLRFSNNNSSSVFTGLIQDGASAQIALVKSGTSSTVSLTGLNTFTGSVTINGGNLDIPNIADIGMPSGIGMGDATSDATNAASLILNGGAIRYVGTNSGGAVTSTQTPSVSINRLFTLAGNGTIASYGSYGNLTASRAANHAALIFNNTADLVFSGTGTRTLTLDGDSQGDNEIDIHLINNPNANEALSLTKSNSGLWILNPLTANTYSGTTTISGGALQAVDGFGLPAGSNLLLSNGVFQTSGLFNRDLGTGPGQFRFTANGNGGFSSSLAKLTVDFGVINTSLGSTPIWGSTPNFLGAGALILNNATSLADVELKGNFDLAAGVAATPTITTTNASATITITTGNTNGLTIGQAITGSNIPAGSYITSITGLTTFTISQNATASGTLIGATIAAGGIRQIQVDDNSSTNLDFATVSGVIGGAGGLGKIGSANLILGDANTYSGRTVIRQDAVFATSIGAAGVLSSSFGTNVGGGILELGNPGSTTTVSLMYVGPGEITTREIDLTGTTGTRRIDSSGTGALVLTNLQNTTASSVNTTGGAKTLELRGTNTDANMVTSILTDNGGALTVSKTDGGVWILNPAGGPNTFTGNVQVNQGSGLLGLTADGIGSAASILLINGGIFAYGGALITSTPVVLGNNSAAVFAGSNNMTFNGTLTKQAGANDQTFSNNLENGAVLTFNGNFINAETAANATRTINIRGYGSTVFNGIIQNNTTTATNILKLDIRLANDASVTLGGDNKGSASGFTGGILLGQGTLIVNNTGGLGPTANNIVLGGGVLTTGADIDLSGATKITNNVFLQGDPVIVNGGNNIEFGAQLNLNASRSLVNNLDSGKSLTLSGTVTNSTASTLTIFGSGNTLISGSVSTGSGAQSLQYSGTGLLGLTGTNTMTGTLTVSRSIVTISGTSGSINAAAGVTLNAGGTLVLDNSGGNNASGRVAGRVFTFNGGALSLIGNNTTETVGAATVNGIMGTISMSGTGATLTFASANFANSGSSWDLSGISDLGGTNKVKITTYQHGGTTFTNTILPRIVITDDFASYNATNGVVALPLASYNTSTNLDGAANADTMNVTGSANVQFSRTLNALKINGSGLSITSTGNRVLTLTTGSLISTGGDNTLAVSQVNLNGQSGYFQIQTGTTLHVKSTLIGGAQLSQVGGGTLSLESASFYNSTTNVMGGTLLLNAGNNAIFPAGNSLNIGIGATVDLNGSSQYLGNLTGGSNLPGAAGTLTNSLTGPLNLSTFVTNGGGTFGGLISGNLSLGRVGGGTLTLEAAQTYTGATYLLGGNTNLENDATMLTTSAIVITGGAVFNLNNNSYLQTQINDRVGDTIPITLNAGTIAANGRVDTAASEKLGAVTLEQGANSIQAATGGTGSFGAFSSMDLTFDSLTRSAGATVNFLNSTTLGSIGNVPRIVFTAAPTTYGDGVLGAWAISNSNDYAAYNPTNGVGTVGNGGFAGYSAVFGSGNITDLGTYSATPLTTTLSGTTTASMLRLSGTFSNNIAFTSGSDVLNLELGGILRTNNPFDTSFGTSAIRGVITAGGTETSGTRELIVYNTNTSNPTFTNPNTAGGIVSGSPVVIMNNTTGIQPGMTLSNANFPTGTTVVSVDSLTQITLSNNAITSAQNQTFTGNSFVGGSTTAGSTQVTVNSTVGIVPGMTIANPGFGGGTITSGSNKITLTSTLGILPGMTLTNANLPAGTTVVSVDSLTQITLSNNATASGTSQTLTGVGIAAGTYVVSVDSPTQVTLSQAATATGTASAFNVGVSNMIINSVIADNGFGNMVSFVKSGTGILNLSANNTYSGGTVVNQGTLNLIGSGVVIPAGGLTINNGVVAMLTNSGQIDPSTDVTLVGSSTLTLAGSLGQNNTFNSITFNNNGGSGTPTVTNQANSILTLTSSTPVTVTSNNASVVPSITGGFLALSSGANTFSIQGPTLNGQNYNRIISSLNITSVITGTGASIIKTDTGLLQLTGQNTFTGGIVVQDGGLILSASSTSTIPNTLVSGPLGIGAVSFADGTTLLVDNTSRTVANAMSFAGNPIFNNTSTSLPTLGLNGALSFATLTTAGLVVNIPTPYLNVYLGGPIANMSTVTSIGGPTGANTITKSGLGNITGLNLTGIGSSVPINIGAINNGTAFSLLADGDLTASLQTINLGAISWEPAVTGTVLSLTIGRSSTGDGVYYPLALNKTIAPASFNSSLLANGLTLANNSNYGLLLVDDIAFNTVAANQGPTFSVSGGSTSLQVDGLTLNGVLSGGPTGASAIVLSKVGGGVLTLTNSGNTFGGGGSIIDIVAGLVAASNDAVLGDPSNIIRLSGNNLGYGFRATGTFDTDRIFNLNSAAAEIEVTQGNTLTLNSAFTFATANNALRKYDLGTLVLTQPETGWNGVMLVQQGVLRISDGAQLGNPSSTTASRATTGASGQATLTPTGGTASYGVGQVVFGTGIAPDTYITAVSATTITLSINTIAANPTITTSAGGVYLSNVGAAIELTGGVTVADNIFVNVNNNVTSNGINGGGAIRSTTGTNTISGLITIATTTADSQMRAVTLTADSGATLNVTGGVLGQVGTAGSNRHAWIGFGGDGTVNLTTTAITNTGTLGIFQLNKFGTGLLNIQVANAFSGRDVIIKQGTLSFNGAGSLVSYGTGQGTARGILLHDAATLVLDNSGTNVTNRLGGTSAALTSWGGDLKILANSSANTSETIGAMTLNAGASVFTFDASPTSQLNFTTAAVTRGGGATLLILADNFGNAAGNGVATIQGSTATYAFTGQTGATGTTNKSILPWAFGSASLTGTGLGFVTADAAAGALNAGTSRLRLLNPLTEQVSTLTTAGTNVNLSGAAGLSLSLSINSLQLGSGAAIALSGGNTTYLTIESGGLLVTDGSSSISGAGRLATASNRELIIYAQGDLSVNVPISNFTGGLTKSGAGTLTLTATNYYGGTLTINEGTVKLAAGDQTLFPNQTLQILGGTLDLNGTVQNFNNVQATTGTLAVNDLYAANTGGTIINTSGSQATLTMSTGGGSFRGAIGDSNPLDSNIAVARSTAAGNTSDWTLYSDNTYTGPTLLAGGRVLIYDNGSLSKTSSVEVSNSLLYFAASNISVETANNTDRINDAAPILLNGSMLQYRSRSSLYTTETMGAVTVGYGGSLIDFAEPGSNVNQSDITFASFAQAAGQHGTVRFLNIDGNISSLQRLFINTLNGVATTNIGDGLTNNIIGGWATFEREFATYTPGMGVAGLNNNGAAGYSPFVDPNLASATDNVRIVLPVTGSTTTLTADRTLYTLNIQAPSTSTANSILDLGGNTLTLASGGLILAPVATTTLSNSITVQNGSLTAGTTNSPTDFYLHALSWFNGQADNTGNADVTISSNIVNNTAGGAVTLVIDANNGRGTLGATNDVFLTGNNTYTGGTFVNSGRVVLNTAGADGVTSTAIGTGDLTIAGGFSGNNGVFLDRNTRVLLGADSQISNTATVNLLGGGTLDLNNFNQTLAALAFNNNGGDTPTVTVGTGMLTLNGDITAIGQNMGSVSTITGTGTGQISLGGSTRTITVDPVQWNGANLNPLQPNLLISGTLSGTGSEGIIKKGDGLLQLSGQNTFSGNIVLQAGGIIIGANSTPTVGGGILSSGPLGTGTLMVASGASLLVDNASRTVANDIIFAGNPIFASTGTATITLTLNGAATLPTGAVSVSVTTPGLTVFLGNIPNIASITSITNTGLGTLIFNTTGYTGDLYATALGNPNSISLLNDGDGSGRPETIALGNVIFDAGIVPTVIVGRAGSSYPYNQAQNGIIAPASFTDFSAGLTVTNNNAYGLLLNDAATLSNPTFSVANATISTLTQGLTLTGKLSGTGFTKTGNGTLALGYGLNDFTGNVVINQGVVSVDYDTGSTGELGAAGNKVVLSPTTGTATLRATDDITTSRVIQLANTANTRAIEVSQGKTLTLTSAFDLNAGAGTTAALVKNDNGTLVLAANNSSWSGGLTINAGAVLLTDANGAGSGAIIIAPASSAQGAALQLGNDITVANAINLQGNNNQALGGINAGGQLESVFGTNTTTGSVIINFDSVIGADAGSTLNINGGINNTTTSARALTFTGDGTINLNSNTTSATSTANQYYSIVKRGAGTLNITTALSMIPTNNLSFFSGTVSLNGDGKLTGGNTIATTVYAKATLLLDNSVTNTTNRLGGRPMTLTGGSLVFVGQDNAASTETLGTLTVNRPGGTVISNPGAGTGTNVLTFSTFAPGSDSTVSFMGTNLGSASNKILFTTTPTLTNNIIARATVNGADFATYAAGTGIAAYTGYDITNNINLTTTTLTLNFSAISANEALTASRTFNAIKFSSDSGVALNAPATGAGVAGGTTPFALTISSGGLLATGGGANSINTAVLAFGTAQAIFHIDTSTSLTITSALTGSGGWVKDGPGSLILSQPLNPVIDRSPNTLSGNASILDGTVVLNSGNNTLPANQFMIIGATGTLDLNGNSQLVRGLLSDTLVENAGGIVTGGSMESSTLVMNQDNTARGWAGVLTGALSFMRTGDNTLTMYSNNDYTGTTFLSGGTTTLRDGGALSGTTDIQIVYATLTIDNTGTRNMTDRVNDAATITLRGGTINYLGRQQYDSTETLGDVKLVRGLNNIFNTAGGTGVNSADLSFGALLRDPSSTATLRFNNLGGHGQLGNGVRTTFTEINGVATTNLGDGLVNNIIGAWAIVDREFATYNPVLGIGGLNAVGFATADGTSFVGALAATDNIRFGTTGTTTLTGDVSINTLTFTSPNAATTLNLGGNTLTLTAGGLLIGEGTDNVNIGITNGFITAGSGGPADLYITHANFGGTNRTVSIDAIIKDNGGPLRLIKSSGDTSTSVMTLNAVNTYTGGTYVNLGTLIIGSNGYIPLAAIPTNGLVISGNNATVTQTTAGTIDPGNYVTINGNATLNLFGDNTLAGLIFTDDGGGSGASQVLSNFGVLTLTGGIVSTTANPASTSTVGGRLDFGSSMSTIDVSATTFNGQELAALLSDFNLQGVVGSTGGITKVGNGVLQFGQGIYTGPTIVQEGRIQVNATNAGARFSALTLGPDTGLNLNGFSAVFGSLSGTGFVMNSAATTTVSSLIVGFDGTDSTFSGLFYRFNDATPGNLGLVKVGVGTLTFDTDGTGSTITGALTINRGAVTFKDNGTSSFPYAAIQVSEGGVLNLDNTGASNNDARLRNGAVTLNGGQLNYLGADATPSAETSTSALTLGPSASVINLTNGAGGTAFLKFGSLGVQGGSTATVIGTNLGTDTKLLFTTAPTLSNGIISRVAVGADFATYDPAKGIIAYTGYVTPTDVNGAAGTATIKVDDTTTQRDINLARSVNAVDIIGNDVTIGSNGLLLPTQGWTISSGGILVNGDNATISTPVLALGAEGIFRVNGSSLNITSAITGTSGITKTGPGDITLSSPQAYTGQTALSRGTMTLAGGRNTILVYPTLTVTAGNLQVNGGTFDLNGNDQVVGALLNSNTLAYAGGVITNSSSTSAVLTSATTTSSIFGANLSGNLAFTKSGNNTLTLPDVQSYTGATIIRSGTVILQDKAVLYSGVSDLSNASVTLNYSTLNLSDSNLNPLDNLTPARLPAGVPVFLNGGSLTLSGGGSVDSAVTINNLTVTNGQSNINLVPYYNSGSTVLIDIGNFVQDPSTGSVTNFVGYSNNNGLATSSLGGQGSSVNGHIILHQINGAPEPVSYVLAATTTANSATVTVPSTTGLAVGMAVTGTTIPAGATIASIVDGTTFTLNSGTGVVAGTNTSLNLNSGLTNNLIGGWAVADGNSFATYVTGVGVSVMGQTTQGVVAPGFDGGNIAAATVNATQNINDANTNRTLLTGVTSAYSLRSSGGTATTFTIPAASSLSLGVGWITNGNVAYAITGTNSTSTLTSPNPFLYVYVNQNTTSIGANITGDISLVKSGGSTLTLNNNATVGSNTYTGTTYVNAGTLTLAGAAGNVIIPGDLVVNNATVTMSTNNNQISATSNVTINGGGVLNLTGTNTLTSLNIYDEGGNGNPTANISTQLTLTAATAITAGNENLSYTPTIAGTKLVLSNANPVIKVDAGLSPSGLIITAPLDTTGGGIITKTGGGSLILNGGTAHILTGGLDVQAGTLVFDNTAATNPYGTGTIILADGVAIRGGTAARTVTNAISVLGNLTFGTLAADNATANATNNLTLSGKVTLGGTNQTMTVNGLLMVGTISGQLTGGTRLTKDGLGTLVLSNNTNNYGGATTVSAGILQSGAAGVIPDGSALTVASGGFFNLNGNNETIGSLAGDGEVINTGATTTLTTGTDGTNTTFSGSLTNQASALNLVKNGAGTQTLSGANSYTGTTTVNAGMLQFVQETSFYNNTPASWTATNLVVGSGATAAFNVGGIGQFTAPDIASIQPLGTATGGFKDGSAIGLDTSNAVDGSFTYPTAITDTNGGANLIGVTKLGAGTLVLTAANTYNGPTQVTAGGLQVGDGTSGALNGIGSVTVVQAGSTILNAPVLSGGSGGISGVGVIAGTTLIGDYGSSANAGVIAPGIGATGTSNQTLVFTASGTALTVTSGSQMQLSITTPTVAADSGILAAINGSTYVDAADYIANNAPSWTTGAPSTVGSHDFISLDNGALSLGSRIDGTLGHGTVAIIDNGYLTGAQTGDVFNLLDWQEVMGGTFATTGFTQGGVLGDIDLPMLSSGLFWDTSAFATSGVLVVVPEPARALLLMFGLFSLFGIRRRRRSISL